jgi:hypothetical protein
MHPWKLSNVKTQMANCRMAEIRNFKHSNTKLFLLLTQILCLDF